MELCLRVAKDTGSTAHKNSQFVRKLEQREGSGGRAPPERLGPGARYRQGSKGNESGERAFPRERAPHQGGNAPCRQARWSISRARRKSAAAKVFVLRGGTHGFLGGGGVDHFLPGADSRDRQRSELLLGLPPSGGELVEKRDRLGSVLAVLVDRSHASVAQGAEASYPAASNAARSEAT